jgi:Ca2+-binding RTX toxin-like protein
MGTSAVPDRYGSASSADGKEIKLKVWGTWSARGSSYNLKINGETYSGYFNNGSIDYFPATTVAADIAGKINSNSSICTATAIGADLIILPKDPSVDLVVESSARGGAFNGYGWGSYAIIELIANQHLDNIAPISSSIAGVFREGVTLTAPSVTGDPDGDSSTPNYAYQWHKNGTAIAGATASTYTVPLTGAGTYKVAITYSDAQDFHSTVDSPDQVVSDISPPTLQSTAATSNQLILKFSEDIQIAGGGTLNPAYMTVTVDGQVRKVTRSQITGPDHPTIHTASQLVLTLSGRSLDGAKSISVSYNPPSNTTTSGFITDLSGNSLASIATQVVDTFSTSTNINKSGIASAYKNLILTGSAPITGYGNTQNNTITGNDANNTLDGLAGADTMIGKGGNDTYFVDNVGDVVTEVASEGIDTVQSTITYTLADNVENLTLLGSGAINGTGNSANNILTGNAGANVLNGNGGTDTLIGGRGNDTYIVDSAGDIITESGSSSDIDSVQSSVSWVLGTNLENLTLTGSAPITGYGNTQNNTITGNDANNTLDGLAGADTMIGKGGNDTYFVDNVGDVVTEVASEGIDTVQSTITYTLADNVENLTLLGSGAINGTGNSANNILTGNAGANVLNGNGGTDTLIGGRGNDTYIVDSAGDIITESGSSSDIDSVQSSVSWVLGTNLENLTLTGSSAINGTGNNLDNIIIGNSASNILDGGNGGTDRLTGLGGADTFKFSSRPSSFRNSSADHITDFSSTQGDKIQITKSAFGITASTATLSVVSSANALTTALSGSSMFVYETSSGELHWNQNGISRGAGTGGVLAILDNKATLSAGDLVLI